MEQGPCYNLCYLDWLQMSQLYEDAKEVGRAIHTKSDHASVSKCTIRRSDQVKSLGILENVVKIKSQTVNIDPTRLNPFGKVP